MNREHFAGSLLTGVAATLAITSACAEPFVDVGIGTAHVEAKVANQDGTVNSTDSGLHLGIGVRRALAGKGEIGVRLELDDVGGDALLAVRAIDYRFNRSDRLALGGFFGAARLSLATPAYGYYLGGGVQLKEIVAGWDLSIDLRLGDKIARDNILPSDPQGGSSDNFYDLTGLSVYLSRRF
jgi:hypothetical protein